MTRVLANLLGADQLNFRSTILELEKIAGKPSKDIRLTTEIKRKVDDMIKDLGLDPSDTTSQELYYALRGRYKRDTDLLRQSLNIENSTPVESSRAICQYIQKNALSKVEVLALKNTVAKKILKNNQPKKTMRLLGYRSLDSMIKHEPASAIFAVALKSEAATWKKKLSDQYKTLQASDFELRKLELNLLSSSRWSDYLNKVDNVDDVMSVKELGNILVIPAGQDELITVSKIVDSINEIRSMSSYMKMQQLRVDFGLRMSKLIGEQPNMSTELLRKAVPWHAVHHYFDRFNNKYDPAVFEPNIRVDDLRLAKLGDVLAGIHPVLSFWGESVFSAYVDRSESSVSFNISDVAKDCASNVMFIQRSIQGMQARLWEELVIRYLDHTNIMDALSNELQPDPVYIED